MSNKIMSSPPNSASSVPPNSAAPSASLAAGTILVVQQDGHGAGQLKTILGFLGEASLHASPENCLTVLSEQKALGRPLSFVLIAGDEPGRRGNEPEQPSNEIERLAAGLEAIAKSDAQLPFLLYGGAAAVESLLYESRIVARLASDCGFQALLDAVHKCKLYTRHSRRLRESTVVSDYNMFRSLVGESEKIELVRKMMGQVANTEVSVLITGESGTGKEVVARNLHNNSSRAQGAFVPINCGAIPRELLESELFGHEKGAFTGAVAARSGRFELADGGTLFLDEIGDMPLDMQVKLLRVLQERSFERVGGVETLAADVRIVAATHRDLEQMIAKGEFRQDLYYRLNVFPIEMPALRERPSDIPLLLNELIANLEAEGRGSVRFNSSAIHALCLHAWPGNVRELANLVERMAILHPHGIVGLNDLPEKLRALGEEGAGGEESQVLGERGLKEHGLEVQTLEDQGLESPALVSQAAVKTLPISGLDLKEYLARLERDLIEKALDDSRGVVSRAADRLSIGRTTLVEKMRKYKLPRAGASSVFDDAELQENDAARDPSARLQ